MQDILAGLMPDLLQLVGTIVGLLLSAVLYEVRRRFGVQVRIEEGVELSQLRTRLTEAVWNAAKAALAAGARDPVAFGLDYLKEAMPDTLARLGATEDVLGHRLATAISDIKDGLRRHEV
ncbi:hypothetical protein EBL87_09045 [Cereibacter sphaeroides]|uniref:hypothetical protein n=1 Tax=Cereibacter sphaeroides TaxID=1063 RepID=UPI000F54C028|nr:hypothetical protein [Cereibacter sphaeroides]AZB63874.1 hypothetical protein EBL87_09045 [Cereibacter sphaeroides]AZB68204.1 hypothetical protein EBL86_07425 [Cereibacter sphaeroides]